MIRSIKMKNCQPFVDAELNDCKMVNFVFGSNGSGKTTIGQLLEGKEDSRFSQSFLEWDNQFHEPIYVYNRQFRSNNFRQDLPGVFTLGNATIEEIDALNELKDILSKKEDKRNTLTSSYEEYSNIKIPECENKFKNNAWNLIFKKNEKQFKKAFDGYRGSKERFVKELIKRRKTYLDSSNNVLSKEELLKRAETLYAKDVDYCILFKTNNNTWIDDINCILKNSIWNTVIVGNKDIDISLLIAKLNNSSWVEQGRKYIQQDSLTCPFCQQETITDTFRENLEAFFDTDYKDRIAEMTQLHENYMENSNNIIDCFRQELNKEQSLIIGNIDRDKCVAQIDLLELRFKECSDLMTKKIKEPNIKIDLPDLSSNICEIIDVFSKANKLIVKHNTLIEQRGTEELNLKNDIWHTLIEENDFLIHEYEVELSKLNKAVAGIEEHLISINKEIDELRKDIIERNNRITSVQPAIDEINTLLKSYGFTGFSIQPAKDHDNYYCIIRDDGKLVDNTLSEGEETFLSFLYFMQTTKGSTDINHVSDRKIIVLDDPISSLDNTILYVVGAMVKDLSDRIRNRQGDVIQLFVLTHNVYFHKEASFINGQTKACKDVNYWMVYKDNGVSHIKAYGMQNPISTSYELLWKVLRESDITNPITIQNTMRRILENYFSLLGRKWDESLVKQFELNEERIIAKSLLAWIHDGSHSIPDDLYIDSYSDMVPKYKEVFKQLFIKSGHEAHYNMMMKNEPIDNS